MRLRLHVDGFEKHLFLFDLLHVSVPLKGEGREVQQTASTRHEMRVPHVVKLLALSVGVTFAAGIRTPFTSPRRTADRESLIPAHSSAPALGTSSLDSPSSSLFSKPPLFPVSANKIQPISYRRGGGWKQKE